MPTYITQADIELFRADIGNYGLNINAMIDKAETDVINYLEYSWFQGAYNNYFGSIGNLNVDAHGVRIVRKMDPSLLNISLLNNLFVYRTLAFYIMPSLMKDATDNEDSFFALSEFYKNKYLEELDIVIRQNVYDFNADSQFDNLDLTTNMIGKNKVRLVRR